MTRGALKVGVNAPKSDKLLGVLSTDGVVEILCNSEREVGFVCLILWERLS